MNERLLTARELGEQLGFAPGTIVDWAEAGKIPAFKLGGRLRFRASEVKAWVEGQRVSTGPPRDPSAVATDDPDAGSADPALPERPQGHDNERNRDDDERDADEVSVNRRAYPKNSR